MSSPKKNLKNFLKKEKNEEKKQNGKPRLTPALRVRLFLINATFSGDVNWPVASWNLLSNNYAGPGAVIPVEFSKWLLRHVHPRCQSYTTHSPRCDSGETTKDGSGYRRPTSCHTNTFTRRPPWTLCGPQAWLGLSPASWEHQSPTSNSPSASWLVTVGLDIWLLPEWLWKPRRGACGASALFKSSPL